MVYDRRTARVASLEEVQIDDMPNALERRLELELDAARRGDASEIVILEAQSEEVLRRSHARYFDDVRALLADR
jgi:hypothetical protein